MRGKKVVYATVRAREEDFSDITTRAGRFLWSHYASINDSVAKEGQL